MKILFRSCILFFVLSFGSVHAQYDVKNTNHYFFVTPTSIKGILWREFNNYWLPVGYGLSKNKHRHMLETAFVVKSLPINRSMKPKISNNGCSGASLLYEYSYFLSKSWNIGIQMQWELLNTKRGLNTIPLGESTQQKTPYSIVRNELNLAPKVGYFKPFGKHFFVEGGVAVGAKVVSKRNTRGVVAPTQDSEFFSNTNFDSEEFWSYRINLNCRLGIKF